MKLSVILFGNYQVKYISCIPKLDRSSVNPAASSFVRGSSAGRLSCGRGLWAEEMIETVGGKGKVRGRDGGRQSDEETE